MDTKSLARSKRAHTQQLNKKHHPNPKSKPTSSSTSDANAKKHLSGKQISEKPRLPSNWDRYEDAMDSYSVPVDVVVPKSKGADFGYLISEAQSRFASFDDVLPDFHQGISSIISVRRNGILSWIGDDNFIVDGNSATNDDASFLSMDLHAIAAKLEKLDVSRRLFIEADILPGDSDVDQSNKNIKVAEQTESHASGVGEQCLDEFAFLDSCQGSGVVDSVAMPCVTRRGISIQSSSYEGTNPVKDDSIQIEQTILGDVVDSIASLTVNDTEKSKIEKTSKFEALAAEAELDMLLNSFGETNFLDSSGLSKPPANNSPTVQWGDSTTFSEVSSSKQPSVFDIDDTIDDLLRDTSDIKNQNSAVPLHKTVVSPYVPASSSNPTAVLDDFDSWLDTI